MEAVLRKNLIFPPKAAPLFWITFLLLIFISSLHVSWKVYYKVDFLYPIWYKLLDIEELASEIGERHYNKNYFQFTNSQEHYRLFSEINHSVHTDPSKLPEIVYADKDGVIIDTMLTKSEITHLEDVANLLSQVDRIGWSLALITCILGIAVVYFKVDFPSIRSLFRYSLLLSSFISLVVLIYGPKELFYQFHIWIFPENNQWFFYYEESLMSLIMRAPYLFGYIGILLLITALVITSVLISLIFSYLKRS